MPARMRAAGVAAPPPLLLLLLLRSTGPAMGGPVAEPEGAELEPYQVGEPPKLHPLASELVVEAGGVLRLRCSGKRPLEWSLPEDSRQGAEGIAARAAVDSEVAAGSSPRPHISHLTVRDLHYLDTGRYTCKYNGTADDWDPAAAAGVHVYASDPRHLIDWHEVWTFVNVPEYMETEIPCRPTDPAVKMTFRRNWSEDLTGHLESSLYRYDPTRGLIVVRGTRQFHTGMIECTAKRDNVTATLRVTINFQYIDVVVPPVLDRPQADNIFVGSNLTLGCLLGVDRSMPHIVLEWRLPEGLAAAGRGDDRRVLVGQQQRRRIDGDSKWGKIFAGMDILISRELHIEHVLLSDQGTFSCLARVDKTDKVSAPAHYVLHEVLQDRRSAFIGQPKFNPEVSSIIIAPNPANGSYPGSAKWIFSLEANPDPEFIWYAPDGQEIDHHGLEKYEKNINAATDDIKLVVAEPALSDTGEYFLSVEVKGLNDTVLEKNISLVLEYLRPPSVALSAAAREAGTGFFFHGRQYELRCDVEGYPVDNATLEFTFTPLSPGGGRGPEERLPPGSWRWETTDGNLGQVHYRFRATAFASADRSGEFACSVCVAGVREVKFRPACNRSELGFLVVEEEFGTGFEMRHASIPDAGEVVEQDEVIMTCGASLFNYTSVQWFKGDDDGEEPLEELVTRTTTDFSLNATLHLNAAALSDSGRYECVASPREAGRPPERRSWRMDVLEMIPPVKVLPGNNMNDSEVEIQSGTGKIDFVLNCNVTGRPAPVITWRKDDRVIADLTNKTAHHFLSRRTGILMEYVFPRDTGSYTCTAENRAGRLVSSLALSVTAQSDLPSGLIAGIVVGLVLLVILCLVLIWKVKIYNRKYKELTKAELELFVAGDPGAINPDLGVDDQADLLPYNRDYEFPRENLKLGKQLGSGAFDRVVKAQASGIVTWERSTTVAVKMVKPHADITYIKALMAELKIMIHLGKHLNILNLLGACTTSLNKRELFVIVEYCRFGSLQKYLLMHRNHFINQIHPDTADIDFQIGADVIGEHGDDLARAREEDEMSAAYANRHLSLTSATDGGLGLTATTDGNGVGAGNGNGAAAANNLRLPPPRQTSVRYIADPAQHAARGGLPNGRGGGGRRNRQESVVSDYNDGLDQIVLTDMTTLSPEEADGGSSNRPKRSLSTASSHQGPGWRSNMRGDYDERTIRPICTKDLICWAYQVTRGMDYLAGKKVMHGDLACRNILLAEDNVVKICDFGLAKDIYKTNNYRKKTDGPLPVKWMAIESLRDRLFSTQSDVWSFGIVLWEMFSLGKTPYPGIEAGEHYNMLLDGYRMERPDFCPRVVYRTMRDCWNEDPSQRPNFAELMSGLGDLLEDGERDHYLNLSRNFERKGANGHRAGGNAVENRDYLAMMCSPDYNQQMSVSCDAGGASEADLMSTVLEEEEEGGYLVPNAKPGAGGSRKSTLSELPTSEEGYLLPQELQERASSSVDDTGYLIPQKMQQQQQAGAKPDDPESAPMLGPSGEAAA